MDVFLDEHASGGKEHEFAPGAHRVFVGTLVAASGVSVAAIVAGHLLARTPSAEATHHFNWVAAVAYTVAGSLIVPRRPRNLVGWLFLLIGAANALVVLAATYGALRVMAWIQQWSFPLPLGLVLFLMLVFPDGRLPSRRWRIVVWTGIAGLASSTVLLALAVWRAPELLANGDAPPLPHVRTTVELAFTGLVVVAGSMVASVGSLVVRWRRADGDTREQLKLLALGGGVTTLGIVGDFSMGSPWGSVIAGAGLPLMAGAAVLRYGLYDVDLVLNRSLVYGILMVCVAAGYAILVTLLGPLFGDADVAPPLITTGILALAFQPLLRRVQTGVNRLLYGERDDPYAVLSGLSRQLGQTVNPATILPRVVESVTETLRLPYAAVELFDGLPGEISGEPSDRGVVAARGRPILEQEAFPLSYQGQAVGRLLVTPRSTSQPLSVTERALLRDLATQAGAAASTVRLTRDLQRSRERLVRSREEERRRLRRDLHDGLGPTLAGVTMQVGAARALLATEEHSLDQVLGNLEQQIQACIGEVRRVVEDLRPPALDQLGLAGAIRRSASVFGSGSAMRITVEAPDEVADLPAAVEVAAYRIAVEAVTNAVRHAQAMRCDVRVTLQEGLVVEVTDDGVGIPDTRRAGVGLAAMRERAEELGGTFTIERPGEGGTRVTATLPVGPP